MGSPPGFAVRAVPITLAFSHNQTTRDHSGAPLWMASRDPSALNAKLAISYETKLSVAPRLQLLSAKKEAGDLG